SSVPARGSFNHGFDHKCMFSADMAGRRITLLSLLPHHTQSLRENRVSLKAFMLFQKFLREKQCKTNTLRGCIIRLWHVHCL
uniref:Uncharacterized protein n=1 Tax=Myripristis murdjan TaxID=586833 RepID=A0A668ANF2_9TELE